LFSFQNSSRKSLKNKPKTLSYSKPSKATFFLLPIVVSTKTVTSKPLLKHRFITGSYDRTCKIWDTESGKLLHTLEGHKNAVYSMAFNVPYG
jgi:WD40 repeat protein